MTKRIVIIGGGASAVSALAHLAGEPGVERITFVAPTPIGLGTAFGTTDPLLLCNTSVDVTSLVADGRSDFLDYLAARGHPVHRADFAPRYLVGQYCRERYTELCARARAAGTKVTHIRERSVGVERSRGGYRVLLAGGAVVTGTDILLCVGADVPKLPDEVRAHRGDPRLIESPYPAGRLRRLPADARVLTLGTKLSAIDSALVLCSTGRRTTVLASPSGTLPAVRTALCRDDRAAFDRAAWSALDPDDASFDQRLARMLVRAVRTRRRSAGTERPRLGGDAARLLDHERRLAAEDRTAWQEIVAELIDTLNTHVPRWSPAARARVLARYRGLMSRYISAIPLRNARLLARHLAQGRLRVADAYPERIERAADGWTVHWPGGATETFDYVVNAAGYRVAPVSCTGTGLRIGGPDAGPGPEILADLRLRLPHRRSPERIWAVGASAGDRYPIVNYLRAAAQHAAVVAGQLTSGTPATPQRAAARPGPRPTIHRSAA
ncbi:FAD/NAD(P)-binding protein [Streptomyces leeuwenhoekii]|uniref:FAD Dependent Oxidoreductase n=1 Tax=Streptomyces leeuwenhoekii TaxID=1437453 RepID=A0A0F7VNF5_STRLW|nr:FAD/NAD(P)-binding protein [Streptomyces leeuwenhoekii]CQR61659.1 FAD Dependent Oxidoreductase [Streptomyces leeuwenhoekii]